MGDRYDAKWMAGTRYDTLRAADFARLCDAARVDLTAEVPTCPEWNLAELCDHVARVYQGRAFAIENAEFKPTESFEFRDERVDPIDWLRTWSEALDRALSLREDDVATLTFMPEATTVHFWRRRMALETLVHRVDAEVAVGTATAMDDDLSADGIDELLWFGSREPEAGDTDGIDATTVLALTDGARRWTITLDESGLTHAESLASCDAVVRGSAPALLLLLSGRDLEGIGARKFAVDAPEIDGDPSALELLREYLGTF